MKKIAFIADLFREQYLGGGECNDNVLIEKISSNGCVVDKILCGQLSDEIVNSSRYETFIVGNFTQLSPYYKNRLQGKKYIIYEHDHKYLKTRDPSVFSEFMAPPDQIINKDFYRNAFGVVVLSKACKEIIEKNLQLTNVYNIGCSLWSDEKLNYINSLIGVAKNKEYGILKSENPVKGYWKAVEYCKQNNIEFDSIEPCEERDLLKQLAEYNVLVFLPQVFETFCRLVAEAKMLNCKVLTKKRMLGMSSEECFDLNGKELLDDLTRRRNAAYELFLNLLK